MVEPVKSAIARRLVLLRGRREPDRSPHCRRRGKDATSSECQGNGPAQAAICDGSRQRRYEVHPRARTPVSLSLLATPRAYEGALHGKAATHAADAVADNVPASAAPTGHLEPANAASRRNQTAARAVGDYQRRAAAEASTAPNTRQAQPAITPSAAWDWDQAGGREHVDEQQPHAVSCALRLAHAPISISSSRFPAREFRHRRPDIPWNSCLKLVRMYLLVRRGSFSPAWHAVVAQSLQGIHLDPDRDAQISPSATSACASAIPIAGGGDLAEDPRRNGPDRTRTAALWLFAR